MEKITPAYAHQQVKYWEQKEQEANRAEYREKRRHERQVLVETAKILVNEPPTVFQGEIVDMHALGREICDKEYDDLLQPALKKLPLGCEIEVSIKVIGPLE